MSESCDPQRRRLLTGLAVSPLLLLCGAKATSGPLTVTLTGQVLIAHDICAAGYPGLAALIAEIRRGDVAVTDLETAIRTAASGAPTREGVFLHQAGMSELRCVRDLGFDALALANNHAGDFGRDGVLATLQAVRDTGFHAAGSGRNLAEASHASRFTANGQPLALVAMAAGKIRAGAATDTSPGINELRLDGPGLPNVEDVARIHASIRVAAGSSRVIAYLHNHDWGDDMRESRAWIRRFAASCIDAGASMFFAHGAPLLHGIEVHRGAPIFHCLGSLVFHSRTPPGHYPPEVWESAIAHLHHREGQLRQIELVPVALNELGDDSTRQNETRGRPRIATGDDAQRILQRLRARSAALGTTMEIAGNRGYIAIA